MRYIEHPEHDLDNRAFLGEFGKIRLYGKSAAPAAPDYTAAAEKTAAGNLEATRAATRANRVNQYTPYGSSTWTQKTTAPVFDQAGYDRAMQTYYSRPQQPTEVDQGTALKSFLNSRNRINGIEAPKAYSGQAAGSGIAPRREDFMSQPSDPDSGWEQTQTLTPQAQATLDKQMALSDKYASTASTGFDKVQELLSNPQLDMSQLPTRAMNVGQTAQEAIMSRLQPQLSQQEEAMRTRLANQGITLGSDAYGKEMTAQGQRANDLQMQAALQGINLDQANRASALQEQAYIQDRPLNLVNALRSGAQVQSPQFQQFAQQQTTGGPNYSGAAQAQYGADMNAYNASQAGSSGMMGGLFSVGMGLANMPGADGSILKGAKGLFA